MQLNKCPFCGTDNPMNKKKRKTLIENKKNGECQCRR